MLKNFFKIAIRNLWRNKGFSAINILGLAVGMGSALLIFFWIQNEVSMDRFYQNVDRIYWMYNRDKDGEGNQWAWRNTPKILAPTIRDNYPEVEDAVRFNNITFLLTVGDKQLNKRGAFVDSGYLNVFSFPFIKGNAATALNNPYDIVLTEKFAKALFGGEDPVGKIVRVDSVDQFKVSAILKDLPNNTQFEFDYLLPWSYMDKLGWNDKDWTNNSIYTFVLLKPHTSQSAFDKKVQDITIQHTAGTASPSTTQVFTQPMRRAYLYAKSENGKLVGGQIETVRLFGIIAAFILLIACINFMNLSTARGERRAKEVGIRKVVGAQKKMLVFQFLGESLLISLLAFILAILLVQISLGAFNQLVQKHLFIDAGDPYFWIFSILFILLTGVLAGSYPAFYLSSFRPVKVLKGSFKKVHALVTPRKILVTVQFTFAIILIIATIIVVRQIKYGLNREAGYDKNNLIYLFTQGQVDKHYQAIRNELLQSGVATYVNHSANPITQRWSDSWGFAWKGSSKSDERIDFVRLGSDVDFTKTMGVRLVAGRDIDIYKYPTDSTALLLNETAVKMMNVKDPIGMQIHYVGDTNMFHVVGVIEDFILESPFEKQINPMMVAGPAMSYFQIMHVKLNPHLGIAAAIDKVKAIFKKYNPQYPLDFSFVDESYARKFESAHRTKTLAALFAGLAILISCLGLFGLATYMAESRIKEIGVRKVLGASVAGITTLVSRDFLKLVIVSFVIASPIAWYSMNEWLAHYTYRIAIEWWVFAIAGLLSVAIALLTVGYQAIKAAVANPVKSLRSE